MSEADAVSSTTEAAGVMPSDTSRLRDGRVALTDVLIHPPPDQETQKQVRQLMRFPTKLQLRPRSLLCLAALLGVALGIWRFELYNHPGAVQALPQAPVEHLIMLDPSKVSLRGADITPSTPASAPSTVQWECINPGDHYKYYDAGSGLPNNSTTVEVDSTTSAYAAIEAALATSAPPAARPVISAKPPAHP